MSRNRGPETDRICSLFRSGSAPCEIIAALGTEYTGAVSYWRRQLGIKPFRKGTWRLKAINPKRLAARKLFADGLTKSDIARRLDLTRERVGQYLNE